MRKVSHILETKGRRVVTVPQEAPVLEVIRLMAEHHIGSVLVMRGPDIIGIATERDYARKVVLQGRSSKDTPVRDIMTAEVITVSPADSAEHCMQVVTDGRIRHLPVIEAGQVVGVVSIGDLVKAVIEEQRQELDHLQRYIAS